MLHTRLHVHSIRLPLVLADVGVHAVNNILADGSQEDIRNGERRHGLAPVSGGEDAHDWSRRAHRVARGFLASPTVEPARALIFPVWLFFCFGRFSTESTKKSLRSILFRSNTATKEEARSWSFGSVQLVTAQEDRIR